MCTTHTTSGRLCLCASKAASSAPRFMLDTAWWQGMRSRLSASSARVRLLGKLGLDPPTLGGLLACRCLLGYRLGTNDLARSRSGLTLKYTRKTPKDPAISEPCAVCSLLVRVETCHPSVMRDGRCHVDLCILRRSMVLGLEAELASASSLVSSLARSLNAAVYNSGTTAAGGGGDMYVGHAHAIHACIHTYSQVLKVSHEHG